MTRIFLNNTVLYAAGEKADELPLHEICKGREGTSDFDTLGYAHEEADALRFAASQDMLAALQAVQNWWMTTPSFQDGEDDMPADIFDGMRDAIAKARGQQ